MQERQLRLPPAVREVVGGVVEAARLAFGDALRAVLLYGSAAEGRMRATSDVNLMFVLTRFERECADRFREPFRFAGAAVRLSAMFVLADELQIAAEEFAQKFADIRRRHVVLFGEDVFADVSVPREALVRRVRQALLNLSMRLREQYVERSLREEQCAITVAETAAPLRAAAASIVELERGETLPPREALETIVREIGSPALLELLPHLSEAREERVLPAGRAAELLYRTIELARALHARSLAL